MKTFISWLLFFYFSTLYAASHHPQEFLAEIKESKNEGQQIVQHFCANCHAANPLINVGAPRINHTSDWGPRIKQGLEQLFIHTTEGYGVMPARGGCFECSDKQLYLAILAMIPIKQQSIFKSKKVYK